MGSCCERSRSRLDPGKHDQSGAYWSLDRKYPVVIELERFVAFFQLDNLSLLPANLHGGFSRDKYKTMTPPWVTYARSD